MTKLGTHKKLLSGLIISAVVLTAGSLVLANNSTGSKSSITSQRQMMKGHGQKGAGIQKDSIKNVLDGMVTEGTINQEDADKLLDYMSKLEEERAAQRKEMEGKTIEERKALMEERLKESNPVGKKGGFLADAVEKGILTQEKADAIEKKMFEKQKEFKKDFKKDFKQRGPVQPQKDITSILNEMVSEGTLEQSKVDDFTAYIKQQQEERSAQRKEMENKTPEERKALMQEKMKENEPGNKKGGFLNGAVEKGIFTQEEVTAIEKKMAENQAAQNQKRMENLFGSLIDKSVLTQEQADKVIEAIQQNNQDMKAAMDKMKGMSQEERRTYMESMKDQRKDVLKSLVDNGTLTQEQADAVKAALPFGQHDFKQRVKPDRSNKVKQNNQSATQS